MVESFLITPSAILLRDRKSRLGLPAYALSANTFSIFLFDMSTESLTVLEIIGIVDRSRHHSSGQDKAMLGINAGMFLSPK